MAVSQNCCTFADGLCDLSRAVKQSINKLKLYKHETDSTDDLGSPAAQVQPFQNVILINNY